MKKNYFNFLKASLILSFLIPSIYAYSSNKTDNGWTVVSQWSVNNNASGLASDGQYIYLGSYGGGNGPKMYRFDPATGANELIFTGTHSAAYGLTFDGTHLWTIDRTSPTSSPAYALQLSLTGQVISQFNLPNHYMSGIAWNNGTFWVATYHPNPGLIHHVDAQGNQLSSFVPPDEQPWDIAIQGDSLWIVDYWNYKIHLMLNDGTLLQSFPYPHHRASGIYHDGTFLWYIGLNNLGHATLYKVDPFGTGTPVINVASSHDFGNVTVGQTQNWDMTILNNGTGELVIDDIEVTMGEDEFSLVANFPINIAPGAFHTIAVSFAPGQVDHYSGQLTISCNDPANLQVVVNLAGNGLFDGAYLIAEQQLIDFGQVRFASTSRKWLQVKNMGNIPLVFESIDFSDDFFYWDASLEFPVTINPVQEKSLPFWFFPQEPGVINAEMELVFNNSEQSPRVIEVKGFSEIEEFPLGTVLWSHQFTGSYDYHAKAIMAVPDISGDNVSDLLVGTRDSRIRMFNGNSSGNPDILWEIQLGTVEYPKAMALIDDINGDGYQDVVVGTAWGDRAVTALSSKTGQIIWRFTTNIYGNGGWVYMVDAKYDYNGNGYIDVLAATGDDANGHGPKRIFLLNGKTGHVIWEAAVNATCYSVLAVEDFTGDGIPDVIAGAGTAGQQAKVFGINGANGNVVWTFDASGSSVWALEQIDDVTDDGIKDIIAGSFNGHYYLLNATNGTVVHSGHLGNVLILDFWRAGDLNGDGYVDMFVAHSSIHNASAICGKTATIIWTTPVTDQPWSVAPLQDITGDQIMDVAIGTLYQNNNVHFICGAEGEILKTQPMPAAVDAIGFMKDITGDGSMEIIAGSRNGYMAVFSGGEKTMSLFEVTFHVTDDQVNPENLENAVIEIDGMGTFVTNEQGLALVVLPDGHYTFTVTLDGFLPYDDSFIVDNDDLLVQVVLAGDGVSTPNILPKLANTFCYPNPFSSYTDIEFVITYGTEVTIMFYDVTGKIVRTVQPRHYSSGRNTFRWDGRDQNGNLLPDGMYFYGIKTSEQNFINRVMILR
jgi:hypothetical protein